LATQIVYVFTILCIFKQHFDYLFLFFLTSQTINSQIMVCYVGELCYTFSVAAIYCCRRVARNAARQLDIRFLLADCHQFTLLSVEGTSKVKFAKQLKRLLDASCCRLLVKY